MHKTILLTLLAAAPLLPAPAAVAQKPAGERGQKAPRGEPMVGEKAARVLADFRKSRRPPLEHGLQSLLLRLTLHAGGEDLRAGRLEAIYSWKKPEAEEVMLTGQANRPHPLGRLAKRALAGIHRDLAGFDPLAGKSFQGCSLALVEGEKEGPLVIEARRAKKVLGRLTFDRETGMLLRHEERGGKGRVVEYGWTEKKNHFLPASRAVKAGRLSATYRFSAYRQFNDFFLPTRILVASGKGKFDFLVQVERINGGRARAIALDPKVVQEAIRRFKEGWNRLDPLEKVARIKELADLGGPEAARELARRLGDRSELVNLELTATLGRLREKEAVPSLCSYLARVGEEIKLLTAVCRALGDIGDPRAVDPLAKGVLSGDRRSREWQLQAKERVDALAAIRDRRAVAELISLLGKCGGGGGRRMRIKGGGGGAGYGRFHKAIQAGLTRLTGREFATYAEWRKWWKSEGSRLKF